MSEPPVPDATDLPADDPTRPAAADVPAVDANDELIEDSVERVSLSARLRQTKTIVSILVPLLIIAFFVALNRETLSKVPGLIAGANPALVLVAFLVFYLGFPLRGFRWATLLRGTGLPDPGQGLDRDPVPLVAGQLPHPGEARRRVPGVPAADQQRRLAEPDVRHRVHRADPRHLHDRDPRDRRRLLELPERAAARDPGGVRRRGGDRGAARGRAVHACATSAGGSSSR